MTAPAIATVSSNMTSTGFNDITVTYASDGPSGIAAGDLLLALVAVNGEGSTPVFTTPGGWTKREETIRTTGSARIGAAVFWKIAGASETSVQFVVFPNALTSGLTAKVVRITGVDPTTPINASVATADSGNDPYSITGVTTTVNDCLVFYLVGGSSLPTRTYTFSLGTEQWDFATDPGGAVTQAASTLVQAVAGATGTETADPSAATTSAGFCVAIAPSPSTGNHRKLPILGVG